MLGYGRGRLLNGWRRVLLAAALLAAVGLPIRAWFDSRRSQAKGEIETVIVGQIDLEEVVVTGGEVVGGKQTEVVCDLENLGASGQGGLRIIQLVPNGRQVAKDEILCRFDASEYEEAARQKELALQQALSELRSAELDLHAAEVALMAYREGESVQVERESRGKIALSKSDLQTGLEHLSWAKQMQKIGYVPSSQVADEESFVLTQQNALATAEGTLRTHLKYTVPRTLAELEARVDAQREQLAFTRMQKASIEERLQHLRDLVKKCTIRAPHDGTLVHFDVLYDVDEWALHEGSIVRQGQPLFYLPERSHLVADISLYETVAARVKPGMKARVRIPAFPTVWIDGQVDRIEQLPTIHWGAGVDVRHFPARVTLVKPPTKVMPGMSAEVRIITGVRRDVLVVPVESVFYEDDRSTCLVVHGPRIERRSLSVRPGNAEWLEVISGLSAGDEVVASPLTQSE